MHNITDTQTHGHTDTQTQHTDTRTHGHTDTQTHDSRPYRPAQPVRPLITFSELQAVLYYHTRQIIHNQVTVYPALFYADVQKADLRT